MVNGIEMRLKYEPVSYDIYGKYSYMKLYIVSVIEIRTGVIH